MTKLGAFQMEPRVVHSSDHDISQRWPAGQRPIGPDEWQPIDAYVVAGSESVENPGGYPRLNFRPWPLRSATLLTLMILCLLMIAVLVLSAVYSQLHDGLMPYTGTYGGTYFLFRILPQLLGSVILLLAQHVITTMFRIIPFRASGVERRWRAEGRGFSGFIPQVFPLAETHWYLACLGPRLDHLADQFHHPLESALFTVILADNAWVWATVQGAAWTLVALYLSLFMSTAVVWRYWDKLGRTGLLWDPRSLADIIVMVSDTNISDDYRGTQIAGTRDTMVFKLKRRADDRLGYWTWKNGRPGFWYTLGNAMDDSEFVPVPDQFKGVEMLKDREKQAAMAGMGLRPGEHDTEDLARSPNIRYRYLPWCMRNSQLLYFVVTAFVLLLALFIVSSSLRRASPPGFCLGSPPARAEARSPPPISSTASSLRCWE